MGIFLNMIAFSWGEARIASIMKGIRFFSLCGIANNWDDSLRIGYSMSKDHRFACAVIVMINIYRLCGQRTDGVSRRLGSVLWTLHDRLQRETIIVRIIDRRDQEKIRMKSSLWQAEVAEKGIKLSLQHIPIYLLSYLKRQKKKIKYKQTLRAQNSDALTTTKKTVLPTTSSHPDSAAAQV